MKYNVKTLLQGDATIKKMINNPDGTVTLDYQAASAEANLRTIKLAPLHLELRVRRLGWLQDLFRHPDHHELLIAALL